MSRLFVLMVLFVSSAASAAGTANAPTLLVFGDSISAGYGIRVDQGWVALLQAKLRQQGYGYQVVNASISGETTAGGLARLPRALALHHPGVVILELGGNDGLRALPIAQMRDNLSRMVALARDAGARVLLRPEFKRGCFSRRSGHRHKFWRIGTIGVATKQPGWRYRCVRSAADDEEAQARSGADGGSAGQQVGVGWYQRYLRRYRDLTEAAAKGEHRSQLALDVFVYAIRHYLGAFMDANSTKRSRSLVRSSSARSKRTR